MADVYIEASRFIRGLRSTYNRLDRSVAEEVQQTAEKAADRAQALAPRLTGRLANSIEASSSGKEGEVVAGAPYAQYVEFGTSRQSPQPFLRPALNEAAALFGQGIRY